VQVDVGGHEANQLPRGGGAGGAAGAVWGREVAVQRGLERGGLARIGAARMDGRAARRVPETGAQVRQPPVEALSQEQLGVVEAADEFLDLGRGDGLPGAQQEGGAEAPQIPLAVHEAEQQQAFAGHE
jgi:hypothetical protein